MLKVLQTIVLFLVLFFWQEGVQVFAYTQVTVGLEEKFMAKNNSPAYLGVDKIDWESFKEDDTNILSFNLENQGGLNSSINQLEDSLMIFNTPSFKAISLDNVPHETNIFPWSLCVILASLGIWSLLFIFYFKAQTNSVKESYRNFEMQYENSKKHWIEKERQLKREIIDLNNRILELEEMIKIAGTATDPKASSEGNSKKKDSKNP